MGEIYTRGLVFHKSQFETTTNTDWFSCMGTPIPRKIDVMKLKCHCPEVSFPFSTENNDSCKWELLEYPCTKYNVFYFYSLKKQMHEEVCMKTTIPKRNTLILKQNEWMEWIEELKNSKVKRGTIISLRCTTRTHLLDYKWRHKDVK